MKNYLISESCSFLVSLNSETYSRIQNLFEFANSKFKSKISRSMRTILNLQFDPIRQKISGVQQDLALEDDFDVHLDDDQDNIEQVPQNLLSFLRVTLMVVTEEESEGVRRVIWW
jgi:hypothetical protein